MKRSAVRVTTTNEYLARTLAREFDLDVEAVHFKSWWRKSQHTITYVYPDDGHWRTEMGVVKFRLRLCRLAVLASWAVADFREVLIKNYEG